MKKYIISCLFLSLLVFACTTSKSTTSGNNTNTATTLNEVTKANNKIEKTIANEQTGQVPVNSPAQQRIMKKKQGNTNTMPMMEAAIPVPDSL